jgi:hypothetical protein
MSERAGPPVSLNVERPLGRHSGLRGRAAPPAGLLVGCVVLLALLMISPAVAASSTSRATKSDTAPYTGVPLVLRQLTTSECGSVTLTHGPKFDLTTGVGRTQANASATSAANCRSLALPTIGEAVGYFGLMTPNFTLGGGSHTLKAVWDLHWTVDLKASGAGSTPANLQTLAMVEVVIQIYDVTAGNGLGGNEWTKTVNRTGDTSTHFVGNQQITVSENFPFNGTHVYQFLTAVEFEDAALVAAGATSGQASATLNFATNGNAATLVSIKGL